MPSLVEEKTTMASQKSRVHVQIGVARKVERDMDCDMHPVVIQEAVQGNKDIHSEKMQLVNEARDVHHSTPKAEDQTYNENSDVPKPKKVVSLGTINIFNSDDSDDDEEDFLVKKKVNVSATIDISDTIEERNEAHLPDNSDIKMDTTKEDNQSGVCESVDNEGEVNIKQNIAVESNGENYLEVSPNGHKEKLTVTNDCKLSNAMDIVEVSCSDMSRSHTEPISANDSCDVSSERSINDTGLDLCLDHFAAEGNAKLEKEPFIVSEKSFETPDLDLTRDSGVLFDSTDNEITATSIDTDLSVNLDDVLTNDSMPINSDIDDENLLEEDKSLGASNDSEHVTDTPECEENLHNHRTLSKPLLDMVEKDTEVLSVGTDEQDVKHLSELSIETMDRDDRSLPELSVETIDQDNKPLSEQSMETEAQDNKPFSEQLVVTVDQTDRLLSEQTVEAIDQGNKPLSEPSVEIVDQNERLLTEPTVKTVNQDDRLLSEPTVETVDQDNKPLSESSVEIIDQDNKPLSELIVETIDQDNKPLSEPSVETVDQDNKPLLEIIDQDNRTLSEPSVETVDQENSLVSELIVETIDQDNKPLSELSVETVDQDNKPLLEPSEETTDQHNKPLFEPSVKIIDQDEMPLSETTRDTVNQDDRLLSQTSVETVDQDAELVSEPSVGTLDQDDMPLNVPLVDNIEQDDRLLSEPTVDIVDQDHTLLSKPSADKVDKDDKDDRPLSQQPLVDTVDQCDRSLSEPIIESVEQDAKPLSEPSAETLDQDDMSLNESLVDKDDQDDRSLSKATGDTVDQDDMSLNESSVEKVGLDCKPLSESSGNMVDLDEKLLPEPAAEYLNVKSLPESQVDIDQDVGSVNEPLLNMLDQEAKLLSEPSIEIIDQDVKSLSEPQLDNVEDSNVSLSVGSFDSDNRLVSEPTVDVVDTDAVEQTNKPLVNSVDHNSKPLSEQSLIATDHIDKPLSELLIDRDDKALFDPSLDIVDHYKDLALDIVDHEKDLAEPTMDIVDSDNRLASESSVDIFDLCKTFRSECLADTVDKFDEPLSSQSVDEDNVQLPEPLLDTADQDHKPLSEPSEGLDDHEHKLSVDEDNIPLPEPLLNTVDLVHTPLSEPSEELDVHEHEPSVDENNVSLPEPLLDTVDQDHKPLSEPSEEVDDHEHKPLEELVDHEHKPSVDEDNMPLPEPLLDTFDLVHTPLSEPSEELDVHEHEPSVDENNVSLPQPLLDTVGQNHKRLSEPSDELDDHEHKPSVDENNMPLLEPLLDTLDLVHKPLSEPSDELDDHEHKSSVDEDNMQLLEPLLDTVDQVHKPLSEPSEELDDTRLGKSDPLSKMEVHSKVVDLCNEIRTVQDPKDVENCDNINTESGKTVNSSSQEHPVASDSTVNTPSSEVSKQDQDEIDSSPEYSFTLSVSVHDMVGNFASSAQRGDNECHKSPVIEPKKSSPSQISRLTAQSRLSTSVPNLSEHAEKFQTFQDMSLEDLRQKRKNFQSLRNLFEHSNSQSTNNTFDRDVSKKVTYRSRSFISLTPTSPNAPEYSSSRSVQFSQSDVTDGCRTSSIRIDKIVSRDVSQDEKRYSDSFTDRSGEQSRVVNVQSMGDASVQQNGLDSHRTSQHEEDIRFTEMSSVRNAFESGGPQQQTESNQSQNVVQWEEEEEGIFENEPVKLADVARESDRDIGAELPEIGMTRNLLSRFSQIGSEEKQYKREVTPPRQAAGRVEYENQPDSHIQVFQGQAEAGIFENQPQSNPDVVRSGETIHEPLPEHGTAKNIASRFKELEKTGSSYTPTPSKRAITPDRSTGKVEYVSEPTAVVEHYEGKAEAGIFESQPQSYEGVVRSGEAVEETLPERGSAKNIAQRFKQMEHAPANTPKNKREITPDRNTKGEYVSEPRGYVETYEGRAEAGVFENRPAERDDVVKSDDILNEPLPEKGFARNVAAKFKQMEGSTSSPPPSPGRVKEFTPPRETGSGVYESNPQSSPDVVSEHQPVEEVVPERGYAKNLVSRFKQIEQENTKVAVSSGRKKEMTPPRGDTGVFENQPDQFTPEYNEKVDSGISENKPAVRSDVYKESDAPKYGEELPERGMAKNLVSRWKQMENTKQSPPSASRTKEFTPPREDERVKALRSPLMSPGGQFNSVQPADLPGQYQQQAEPSVFESEPQHLQDVYREADTDWTEGMPKENAAKKMVAKFKHIQSEASKEPTKPVSRKEDGDIQSPESQDAQVREFPPARHISVTYDSDVPDRQNENKEAATPKKKPGVFIPTTPAEKCGACQKTVYAMEKFEMNKVIYHKNCFRCSHCKSKLTPKTFAVNNGIIYCTNHLMQLFKSKGNYDEGFGREQHKKKWSAESELRDGEQEQT